MDNGAIFHLQVTALSRPSKIWPTHRHAHRGRLSVPAKLRLTSSTPCLSPFLIFCFHHTPVSRFGPAQSCPSLEVDSSCLGQETISSWESDSTQWQELHCIIRREHISSSLLISSFSERRAGFTHFCTLPPLFSTTPAISHQGLVPWFLWYPEL